MTLRLPTILLLLGLFITGCGNRSNKGLTGKFFLSECPTGSVAPDAIEFRSDGSCLVDAGDRAGIAGKYGTSAFGYFSFWFKIKVIRSLTIEADTGVSKEFTSSYELGKYTLTLQDTNGTSLIYVRMPEGPRPQFSEILGKFSSHNDLGDSVGEITADHKFRGQVHDLISDDHTYYDIHMDGTCSYSNGIVTYVPEHSDAPQQDKYLRDFIIRRDEKGLWVIDEFHDSIMCESPATNLDLPPVPAGYRKAPQS